MVNLFKLCQILMENRVEDWFIGTLEQDHESRARVLALRIAVM